MGLASRLRAKTAELTARAKQDARRADRTVLDVDRKKKARAAAQRARELSSAAADRLPDDGKVPDDRDVYERARAAGEANAPVDATLDPMGDARAVEQFAMAGPVVGEDEQTDPSMGGLVTGGGADDGGPSMDALVTGGGEGEDGDSFVFGSEDSESGWGWF